MKVHDLKFKTTNQFKGGIYIPPRKKNGEDVQLWFQLRRREAVKKEADRRIAGAGYSRIPVTRTRILNRIPR